MKVASTDPPFPPLAARAGLAHEENLLESAALSNVPALSAMEDVVPRTVTPSRIGSNSGPQQQELGAWWRQGRVLELRGDAHPCNACGLYLRS